MTNQIRGDRNVFLKAQWEHATDNKIKQQTIRNAVQDMKRRRASDLQARKAKLA